MAGKKKNRILKREDANKRKQVLKKSREYQKEFENACEDWVKKSKVSSKLVDIYDIENLFSNKSKNLSTYKKDIFSPLLDVFDNKGQKYRKSKMF